MFLRIERASAVPVSRQIADQIRALWAAGSLSPGDRLPSVRALARELAVNQNTVLRVYERLTADGLLVRRHGDGTFIAGAAGVAGRDEQRERFADELAQVVRRGRMLGLPRREIERLVGRAWGVADDEQEANP